MAPGGPRSAGYAGASHQERLTTTVGSTTTTWTNSPLGETSTSTGAGSTLVSYVRDPGGQLIGIRVGTSTNATRYYFTFDGLGSITGLTDSTGSRVNTYRYDPYGQLLSSSEGLAQPFRYTGGIHDSATSLTKLGIRYYDPALGRFTQPDPTGQDPHYTYGANAPISYVDPSGSASIQVEGCYVKLLGGCLSLTTGKGGRTTLGISAAAGLDVGASAGLQAGQPRRGTEGSASACALACTGASTSGPQGGRELRPLRGFLRSAGPRLGGSVKFTGHIPLNF